MPDVFISYATPDREWAKLLATALREEGLETFFDEDLKAGDKYHSVLEERIQNSDRVIVLWSESSVQSRWVLSEAEIAAWQNKLIPLRLDRVSPPAGFTSLHTDSIASFLHSKRKIVASWRNKPASSRKIVAVVDDDPVSRNFVSSLLQNEGYLVKAFASGSDALEVLPDGAPDLAVIDFIMPSLDGIELIRKLRSVGARYPIVVLTSKSDNEDEVLGLISGADDYVRKPFATQAFLARIKAHLRKARN
jgi:CheY-like chemotaxis protein